MPTSSTTMSAREIEGRFLLGLGRAAGGAVVFSLPVLMTMEMWSLGAGMDRVRLFALVAALLPLLVALSHFIGFEETDGWLDDVRDGLVAFAVGMVTSAVILALFGLIEPRMSFDEIMGAVVIEAVPASIGAAVAQGQFGQPDEADDRHARAAGYWGELVFMATGALFLSFSVAPTEEVDLIAAEMSPVHMLLLALVSIMALHLVVYMLRFSGQETADPAGAPGWSVFLRYTLAGYAVALLVCAGLMWAFGRFDDLGFVAAVRLLVVLGFPAAIGAAFARLIV
ncbi:TIGR02587 family membrane protein [Methylopila musalis]|uniref:TIGR02587 family membrane protein n=1 Tax=Methylopila musalis TaxID=1134781 RepID=A0ABW3Z6A1_9HYPH